MGGSSRIPLVGEMVSAGLGRPVAVDGNPKHAISQGAAVAAAQALGEATADSVTVVDTHQDETPAAVVGPVAGPAPVIAAAPVAWSPQPTTPAPPISGRPPSGRKPPLVPMAIGAVAAVVLATVGFFVLRGGDDEPSDSDGTDSAFGEVTDQGDLWVGGGQFAGLLNINRSERSVEKMLPVQNVFDPPIVGEDFIWAL